MSNESRLRELVEQWLASLARGQNPSAAELCGPDVALIEPLEQRILAERKKRNLPELQSATHSTVVHIAEPHGTSSFELDQSPSNHDDLPGVGKSFAGFKLLSVLGEGSFGTVFRAEDIVLRRKVALKVLRPRAIARAHAQETFLAEARALASVQHDHVVPIFQVGRQNGQLFLAMPLLGGETLSSRMEREGALPADEVCRIGREIASGLSAIHAKGLVHRDLKPANIWLEVGSGRVKVLDLGLAQDSLATAGPIAGTPPYMSPEQAEGKDLDFRSDLFSLGTVLYECASGRRPFGGSTKADTLRSIREETPPSVCKANPGVPGDLSTVVDHLHRKDPADRPASAKEVEALLQPASRSSGSVVPTPKSNSHRGWLIANAALVLVPLVGYVAWSATRPKGDDKPLVVPPKNDPVVLEPLRIKSLEVHLYPQVREGKVGAKSVIGKETSMVHLEDEFEVRATLTRPAYCYLIVYRPDGKSAVLYPQDDSDIPEATATPIYPSKRRTERYLLEPKEQLGLWVVALLASEDPLPSYRDWHTRNGIGPWINHSGKPGWVWLDDGQILESFENGTPRGGDRAGKDSKAKSPIVGMTEWLKSKVKGTTSTVGFTVQPRPE